MYSQGLAQAQALAAQQLLQTLPKVIVTKCTKDQTDVVGVRCPNGTYYLYIYDGSVNKFVAHQCSCQPLVSETDLRPLYAANSQKLLTSVIFMHNTISRRVEQYVYDFDSDSFKEVKHTGLVYNPALVGQSNLICMLCGPNDEQLMIEADQYGSLRKQISRDGLTFKVTTRSEVKTLMMQSLEEKTEEDSSDDDYEDNYDDDEDSEYESESDSEEPSEEDLAYDEYIGTIAPFVLLDCAHHPASVINAFNYTTDNYNTFFFNDVTGRFVPMDCNCEFAVTEYSLVPKYVQQADDGKLVIHVHNLYTNIMEKYCYVHGEGLVQVDYPELVYFAGKTTTSAVILTINDPSPVVIMRNPIGRLFTETYSHKTCNYVTTATKPVKTFLVQRKEAERKKREQERLESQAARAEKKTAEKMTYAEKQIAKLMELSLGKEKPVREFEEYETIQSSTGKDDASEMAQKAVEEIHSKIKFPVITLDTPRNSEQAISGNGTERIRVPGMAKRIFGPAKSEQALSGNATASTRPTTEKTSASTATEEERVKEATAPIQIQPTQVTSTSTAREPLKDITDEALYDSEFNDNRMKEISSKKEKKYREQNQPMSFIFPSCQSFPPVRSIPMPIYMPRSSQQEVQQQQPTMQQGSSTGSSSSQQEQNPQEQDQLDKLMDLFEQVIDKFGPESLDVIYDELFNKTTANDQKKQKEAPVSKAPAKTIEGKSNGNKEKSEQQIIKLGSLSFVQDPKDSQKWIITDEAKADNKAEQSGEKERQPLQQVNNNGSNPVVATPMPNYSPYVYYGPYASGNI